MKTEIAKLRADAKAAQAACDRAKSKLLEVIRNCQHRWGQVQPDHIYEEGYTIPGDPVGTMGVDWRGPVYVQPKQTKRWKRVCQNCGEEQFTTNVRSEVIEHPKFAD